MLRNDLVVENFHSTSQIILRLQDRLCRVFLRQQLVLLPIEIAAVAIGIHIRQLQQAFASNHPLGHCVPLRNLRLRMTHIGGRHQPRLRTRQCLEEICPVGALICITHDIKSRTEWSDSSRHPGR
jgi:hypothetical protein